MARPIPMGKTPPSLTVIDIKGKPKPGADAGREQPDEQGEDESEVRCPECGASLCLKSKGAEDAEDGDEGDDAPMAVGMK